MSSKFYCLISLILFFQLVGNAQNCECSSLNDINNPGPYSYSSINQNDGIRNGPDYGNATIYYPTGTITPLASIILITGYFATQSSIQDWGPFLASNGIVTMTIDANSIFDYPYARRDGLIDAIITLKQENTRNASPLLNKIDINKIALGGWSMGGGAAQLAANLDPSIKAVLALAPWLSIPTSADLNHNVPVLILSGEFDVIAAPNFHADIHYNLTPNTTDKMLFEVNAGSHSVANNPNNAGGDIGKYGLTWLRNYLQDGNCNLFLQASSFTSQYLTNIVGPIDTPATLGCINPDFCEYNPNANCDDGSCLTDCCNIPETISLNNSINILSENLASDYVVLEIGFEAFGDFLAAIDTCQ